ncbi:MAG: hypothetical protein QOH12_1371 [Solirubrobacteraceae bacterium]|nr:hypothetical protein [Solirubrobacteraceae bacterium]
MRLYDEHGFTMIEMLISLVMLLIGITALAETFVAAGKLTSVAERQAAMSHAGRSELERLQTLSYAQLAMSGSPGTSASPTDPDYYVSTQSSNYYLQVDPGSPAKEQLVIDAANGRVSPAGTPWSGGNTSGSIFEFVTYHTDGGCGVGCPASANYKRIVVEVTQSVGSAPKNPLIIQTLVADVTASPTGSVANGVQNPLQSATTQCGTPAVSCQVGIDQGNANSFYLYDQAATGTYSGPPTLDNTLHNTVGILAGLLCNGLIQLGCPIPDLMGTTSPASVSSTLQNYSTDQGGPGGSTTGGGTAYQGGRILKTSSGTCSTAPPPNSSTSNPAAETWVTGPVAAAETLNGQGGMTLFMQSANGLTASVTLCVAVWVYPQSILNLISVPAVKLGVFAEAVASLPATPIPVSFTFSLASATSLGVGQRIGIEVWLAASSTANAAIQYDNPAFASVVQLNTS